ncbi:MULTISPECIES: LLM class flavin-dependent oxidoreductase [Delftia]|uniref:LLM class flavin-dependent oxidoreductase n=1 Tax=Delftia TaxID=80865 RepID=UPI0007733C2D|nr:MULTISPECIES: LLM class flavin-dependent oxidoreductase [Delftia]MCO5339049.1 LLM class flavin-dependent oxidoreductase [Delftia tsuruhatensis]MCR4543005.1 LLM class flavin-dependent oxidoreductase [Delftia tsuruhatensis]MPT50840.1 LLM class flavin-dependent oxidoreductase [Delftia sp.]SFB08436.1 luciferase family oxidoreductase, group 1 [Delftia tsuruhatensis]
MTSFNEVRLSMLDLVAVREGGTVAEALDIALATARKAEALGFERYWLAEHHNMPGIASSATAVLIGHIAGGTSKIRVGSGGIMLPNHAPLVVAEAFGTLAELYPGRIDLGLGRAPGTDGATMRALRRDRVETEEDFPRDVMELQRLLGPATPDQKLVATPGAGTNVPIWLLGSSLFSAQLAAHLGLPYAFASHFAPRMLYQAVQLYRSLFKPSAQLAKPYVIVGAPVIAAPTDDEAEYLASSTYQRVLGIITGRRGLLPRPIENYAAQLGEQERRAIGDFLAVASIGGPDKVRTRLQKLQADTEADELILVSDVYDRDLRLRSLEITAGVMGR